MHVRSSLFVTVLALAMAGCGDSPVPVQQALTATQFVDGLGEVACRRVTACAPAQAPLFCPLFQSGLECTRRAVAAGLISYHGDNARKCLDELAALTCDQLLSGSGGGFHTASCDGTINERFDMGQLVCDQDGGVHVGPLDPAPLPDGGITDGGSLPEGMPCNLHDDHSIEACPAPKGCHSCLALHGDPAGVCVEVCTVAQKDCTGGRTCRPLQFGQDRTSNGLNCGSLDTGDGYCD